MSAELLLLLQKKVLVIEKKDDQIVKLNSGLTGFKNELHELRTKNSDISDELF